MKAEDIVVFCDTPEMLDKLGRTKSISVATARRWLIKTGYRWVRDPRGQYVDRHKRVDVVEYRQHSYVPAMMEYASRMRRWIEEYGWALPPQVRRAIVVWFHDESTFYANDRRKSFWMEPGASPAPYTKGEGQSLMIADFVSADYGWLRSPDGKESARLVFKAGKDRDGYMQNDAIIKQFETAVAIVLAHYSGDDHIFVYDNATTHQKWEDGAISASKMPKGPSPNFFIEVNVMVDGKQVYAPNGKPLKEKQRMSNGKFANGEEQSLYYPDDHEAYPGWFKGTSAILTERGYDVSRKKSQCGTSFHRDCPKGATDCCCRRQLYNEPDFKEVESRLEVVAKGLGVKVLFLPKFHCELNFIEQCWGYAKRRYRLLPASPVLDVLEKNVLMVLDEVPLETMRRFSIRSLRFVDAYHKNLGGSKAAWAAKKYRGHRTIPESILRDLEEAGISD